MASLDDILTTQKNGVVAINGLNRILQTISDNLVIIAGNSGNTYPSTVSNTIAASTTHQEVVGSGKLFSVSIPVHAGSAQIYVYDSATTGGISAANLIYASQSSNAASFKPYEGVALPYVRGLVLKTDAGMNFCVGYTPN
jgi:hypothetical protein